MFEEAREQPRQRQLGSDARAGRRVREQTRRTQWEFVRRNAGSLGGGLAIGAVVTALAAVVAPTTFLSGAIVGGGTVFVLGGLSFTVLVLTGTASHAMGGTGELWTSQELRPLRKLGWKDADHVFYRFRDLDHVLVGPGGAVVVETKWSATAWVLEPPEPRLLEYIEKAQQSTRDFRLSVPQLRQRPDDVRTVLFLWGCAATGVTLPTRPVRVGVADVVYGVEAARAWRDGLAAMPAVLDPTEVDEVWARVLAQAGSTDDRDRAEAAPLPSLSRLYWTAAATLIAAFAGFLAVGFVVDAAGSAWATPAAAVAGIVLGVLARRVGPVKIVALGWLTGVVSSAVAVGALVLAN